MTKITYIPGEIANAAIDEHGNRKPVTRTHHIFDDAKDKNQAEVNAEVDDTFAFHQSEINALNSQNYVTVDSFSSLPATGAVDTVYRVSNWDGTQQDPSVYSEYAWNGEDYVHLSTKTQIGEVFDISAYHATGGELAKYADLAAALGTNGANIPQSLRKGGMSVKFVLSSDNKYVQFRYMSSSTAVADFTNVVNWQGVDTEVLPFSKNIVESNAVDKNIKKITGVHIEAEKTWNATGAQLMATNIGIREGDVFNLIISGTAVYSTFRLYSGNTLAEAGTWVINDSSYTKNTVYTFTAPCNINKLTCYPTITAAGTLSIKVDVVGELDKKVNISDIVNTLNENEPFKPLSAAQGKKLIDIRNNDRLCYDNLLYSKNLINHNDLTDGYLLSNGEVTSSPSYKTSNFIRVDEGKTYYYRATGGDIARFAALYDSEYNYIANSLVQNISTISIPNGAQYIRVTFGTAYTDATLSDIDDNTHPVYRRFFKDDLIPNPLKKLKEYAFTRGSLSSEGLMRIHAYANSVKKNERVMFTGIITDFSSIEVGFQSSGTTKRSRVIIDDANITVYVNADSSGTSYAHGLTIENNIQVLIETDATGAGAKVSLVSNGQRFQKAVSWGKNAVLYPYASSNGSNLTNCCLSWTCTDLSKDIWMFGDSYFSYTDRWFYYLYQDGYHKNVLMDAFPGEAGASSLISLKRLLLLAKPKRIIWCLGMNDGSDSSTTYSSTWGDNIKELMAICDENDIDLILATIPSVPTINHKFKNRFVRNSGLQYIDFANAVGANETTGAWFEGMLSQDGVHPTDAGAKALYMAVVTDAPQVMIDY